MGGFAILLILMVFLTGFGAVNIITVDTEYSYTLVSPVDRLQTLYQMEIEFMDARRILNRSGLLMSDPTDPVGKVEGMAVQANESRQRLNAIFTKYRDNVNADDRLSATEASGLLGEIGNMEKEMFAFYDTYLTDIIKYAIVANDAEVNRIANESAQSTQKIDTMFLSLIASAEKVLEVTSTELTSQSWMTTYTLIIIAVVGFIISIFIALIISGLITKPLKITEDAANKIADGDLTVKIPQNLLDQKEELGALARNIESMKESLLGTVSGIKNSAETLSNAVDNTNSTLKNLSDCTADTSAATEELSAGMEETGASAEEMNATASEIERAVETIAEKAEDGASKSGEINNRATELGKSVNDSISKSNNIFNDIKKALEKALEESKAVDEINALADAILGITSQTTLLALNASIEAARAGEAGRGFAVVANEISALADNSKNTVTQIQAITKIVMAAVNALATSSTNLLNFVSADVMKDYNDMLQAAESYTNDSIYISDMTSDLSATSEELLASIQVLMRAINEVASAAQEGAKTTSSVAEQVNDITDNTGIISNNIKDTENSTAELVDLVRHFKI